MEQKKKTSDELTPEDKEAFRFYFETVFGTYINELGFSSRIVLDIVEDLVKEEKRRLNVS